MSAPQVPTDMRDGAVPAGRVPPGPGEESPAPSGPAALPTRDLPTCDLEAIIIRTAARVRLGDKLTASETKTAWDACRIFASRTGRSVKAVQNDYTTLATGRTPCRRH